MRRGLIDRDITPTDRLAKRVGDVIDTEIGGPGTVEELIAALSGKDVVFTTSRLPISRQVLERTDLDLVAKIGTGVDNVDLETARDRDIPVTYTPGTNAIAVAEHTIGLILAVTNQFERGRRTLRAGGWRDEVSLGRLITGKTIGIVGFGNCGRRVAALLAGFHATLLAYDPYIDPLDTEPTGTTLVSLEDLLKQSDIVTINAELTAETRGLIGKPELERMDEDAILVNTARGPIVDEAALINALRQGRIAGAGLDVFAEEPLPADSPLHDLESAILTPHIAGISRETRHRAIDLLADNALAVLAGDTIPDRYLATDN